MSGISQFRLNAPEFSNVPDSEVELQMANARLFSAGTKYDINVLESEPKKDLASAFYAAHLCWLKKYPGQGGAHRGAVLSERDDKLQRDYRPVQGTATWLGQSHYGLSFINLMGGDTRYPAIMTRFG